MGVNQSRIRLDSGWPVPGRARQHRRAADQGPAQAAADQVIDLGPDPFTGMPGPGQAKPADGILVNPAGRRDVPDGYWCAVAAFPGKYLPAWRQSPVTPHQEWEHARAKAIPLKEIPAVLPRRGPRSIDPGIRDIVHRARRGNTHLESQLSLRLMGNRVTRTAVIRECRSHGSEAAEHEGHNKNSARRPGATSSRVLTGTAARRSAGPCNGMG